MAEDPKDGGTATADAPAGHVDPALGADPGKSAADASASPDAAAKPDSKVAADTAVVEPPKGPARGPDGKFISKADQDAADYSSVTLPKDSTLAPAVLERTVAIARERGLSAEQAQATLDLVNEQVSASRTELLASHQPGGAEWTKQADAWKAATLADPSLGTTPEERTAAIQKGTQVLNKFAEANPEKGKAMVEFLNTSGLGEHPAVVNLFVWLGKAMGEQALVRGRDTTPATNAVVRTYQETSGMNP